MNRILIIEDEEIILKALKRLLERNHFDVTGVMTVEDAIKAQPQSFDLILADLRLPGAEGTDIIPIADPIPVVIMTSHASVRSAVTAMRNGAIDYIAKPFDHDELLLIIERSLKQNRLRTQNQALRKDLARLVPSENLKQCIGMRSLLQQLNSIPESEQFISLIGESGTGKELLARLLHAHSERAEAPFVVADLPATEPSQMADLLLGRLHGNKSDFSNATARNANAADVTLNETNAHSVQENANTDSTIATSPELTPDTGMTDSFSPNGLLHAAHNGTLVLRHPSVMSIPLQHDLAAALTAKSMIGYAGERAINVRTIIIADCPVYNDKELEDNADVTASTNDTTNAAIKASGELSEPLASLFKQWQLHVPPLRELREDITTLAENYLQHFLSHHNRQQMHFDESAIATMKAYDWPGNTDELKTKIERAVLISKNDVIEPSDLGLGGSEIGDFSLEEYFRYFVLRNQTSLSETELASRLGISRKALWERRQKSQLLRINPPKA